MLVCISMWSLSRIFWIALTDSQDIQGNPPFKATHYWFMCRLTTVIFVHGDRAHALLRTTWIIYLFYFVIWRESYETSVDDSVSDCWLFYVNMKSMHELNAFPELKSSMYELVLQSARTKSFLYLNPYNIFPISACLLLINSVGAS